MFGRDLNASAVAGTGTGTEIGSKFAIAAGNIAAVVAAAPTVPGELGDSKLWWQQGEEG